MVIKLGRLRIMLTLLPSIPKMIDPPECERLARRIALRRAGHKKTSQLERQRALAKFGISS